MSTLQTVLDRAGIDVLHVLDAQIDVPVLAGVQAQGDLVVVPTDRAAATTPVPADGVVVVAAEISAGNQHILHAWDGPVFFDAADGDGLIVGTVTVPQGSSAYLVHTEEHGANGIAPGTYDIRRQQEQADQAARNLAD